jgi:hypothetical protein
MNNLCFDVLSIIKNYLDLLSQLRLKSISHKFNILQIIDLMNIESKYKIRLNDNIYIITNL